MISLPNPTTQSFADYVATQDARNTIELNIRKYTLMLCDALADNFKSRNRGTVGGHAAPEYKFYIAEGGRKYHKIVMEYENGQRSVHACLLYTSPSPRDRQKSRMPSSA